MSLINNIWFSVKLPTIKCLPPSVRPLLGQGLQGRSRSMEETEASVSKEVNSTDKLFDVKESGVCIVM